MQTHAQSLVHAYADVHTRCHTCVHMLHIRHAVHTQSHAHIHMHARTCFGTTASAKTGQSSAALSKPHMQTHTYIRTC